MGGCLRRLSKFGVRLEQELAFEPELTIRAAHAVVVQLPGRIRQVGVGVDVAEDRRAVGQDEEWHVRPRFVQTDRRGIRADDNRPAVDAVSGITRRTDQLARRNGLNGRRHSIDAADQDLILHSGVFDHLPGR